MTSPLPNVATSARLVEDRPVLALRAVGDGRAFIRAIARVIVRRELISAGLIADPDACSIVSQAG